MLGVEVVGVIGLEEQVAAKHYLAGALGRQQGIDARLLNVAGAEVQFPETAEPL